MFLCVILYHNLLEVKLHSKKCFLFFYAFQIVSLGDKFFLNKLKKKKGEKQMYSLGNQVKTLFILSEFLKTFEENFQKEVERKEKKFKIPPEAKALGMYLRRLRKELGLSRDEAGKAVNRVPHLITYYENGYVPPLEEYVVYLATKAGLSNEKIESLLEKTRYVRTLRRKWR